MRIQVTDEDEVRDYFISGNYERPDGEIKAGQRYYPAISLEAAIAEAKRDGLVTLTSASLRGQQ